MEASLDACRSESNNSVGFGGDGSGGGGLLIVDTCDTPYKGMRKSVVLICQQPKLMQILKVINTYIN
jgi:hypothetical protein